MHEHEEKNALQIFFNPVAMRIVSVYFTDDFNDILEKQIVKTHFGYDYTNHIDSWLSSMANIIFQNNVLFS